jgi:Na+/melibiose symporter-like transporter
MTRRGTLAYYLAAWVIGCFVAAVLFFSVTGGAGAAALLLTYFFTLIVGATDLLIFAFLLRRLMGRLGTHRIGNWALAGAALSSLLMLLFAWISSRRPAAWGTGALEAVTNVLVGGAEVLRQTGFWQAPVDGAVTAVVLCLVDRAFDRPAEAPESAQPAA